MNTTVCEDACEYSINSFTCPLRTESEGTPSLNYDSTLQIIYLKIRLSWAKRHAGMGMLLRFFQGERNTHAILLHPPVFLKSPFPNTHSTSELTTKVTTIFLQNYRSGLPVGWLSISEHSHAICLGCSRGSSIKMCMASCRILPDGRTRLPNHRWHSISTTESNMIHRRTSSQSEWLGLSFEPLVTCSHQPKNDAGTKVCPVCAQSQE